MRGPEMYSMKQDMHKGAESYGDTAMELTVV
jgi:hypothetical protein